MLDLNDVAIFVHVVRAGSFAAAGRKMGMPPNTLSRRVQLLENSLGTRLLVRSTRKLNLTASGSLFYEQCAENIVSLEQAGESLLEVTSEPIGIVRATAPVDFFNHFPLDWVADFMARYPKIQLEFLLDDRKIDLIEESVDVAFRAGRREGATLVARKLADSTRGLFASPDFVARHGVPEGVAGLARIECITPPVKSGGTIWKLSGPEGEIELSVSGRFRANTAQAQAQAARAGLGIALLPIALANRDLASGHLVRILPDYAFQVGGLYAVSPSRRLRTPAVSVLIDFIAAKLSDIAQLT